jgi:uncharacterized protein (TIGR04255 family)
LALVAVELRFPNAATGRQFSMPLQRSFRDILGEAWVIEAFKVPQISLAVTPTGTASPQTMQSVTIPRFTVRDRTLAVAVTEDSMTIETTRYRHYPEFRETIERAVAAAAAGLVPDGVARVGMRYINEIRVPRIDEDDPALWTSWIAPC